jgi:hypothetical protein
MRLAAAVLLRFAGAVAFLPLVLGGTVFVTVPCMLAAAGAWLLFGPDKARTDRWALRGAADVGITVWLFHAADRVQRHS